MKKDYLASQGISSSIIRMAQSHGFNIGFEYDDKHGVSNEGINVVDGFLDRPKSTYAQDLVKDTVLLPIVGDLRNRRGMSLDLEAFINLHKPDNTITDSEIWVFERKTSNGLNYSRKAPQNNEQNVQLSHFFFAIDTTVPKEHEDNVVGFEEIIDKGLAIKKRFDIELEMYNKWINNQALKMTVKPKTWFTRNITGNDNKSDGAYEQGGIYLYGLDTELARTRDLIAEQALKKAINSSGVTFHLEMKVRADRDADINSDILNKLNRVFGFTPVFKHTEIVKGVQDSILSVKLSLNSVPPLDVLIKNYVERGKLGYDGALARDFLTEVMQVIGEKMAFNNASIPEINAKQLECSLLLNKWMMNIISVERMKDRKLIKAHASHPPKDLMEAVLFTVFKLAAPTNVIGLAESNVVNLISQKSYNYTGFGNREASISM